MAGTTSNLAAVSEKRDASGGWWRRRKRIPSLEEGDEKTAPAHNTHTNVVVVVLLLLVFEVYAGFAKRCEIDGNFRTFAWPKTKDAGESYEKRYPITINPLPFLPIDLSMYFLCAIVRLKFRAAALSRARVSLSESLFRVLSRNIESAAGRFR